MAYHHHNLRPGSASGSASSSSSGLHFLNSPFGDTTLTKVFVGGLAWETTNETLRRYFEQFGDILEAVVITDKNSGRSKGYGFVTFREPDSARRACENGSPVIDGRRANCNLASLGRVPPPAAFVQPRLAGPYIGGVPVQPGPYIGNNMHQNSVPLSYQQGYPYPPYSYASYGQESLYPQNMYNPYTGQQYMQVYNVPGTVNTAVYPFGPYGQLVPSGHGYATPPGYMTGHRLVTLVGSNVNGSSSAPQTVVRTPYPAGLAAVVPPQTHLVVPAHSPSFTPGNGSEQAAG